MTDWTFLPLTDQAERTKRGTINETWPSLPWHYWLFVWPMTSKKSIYIVLLCLFRVWGTEMRKIVLKNVSVQKRSYDNDLDINSIASLRRRQRSPLPTVFIKERYGSNLKNCPQKYPYYKVIRSSGSVIWWIFFIEMKGCINSSGSDEHLMTHTGFYFLN